MTKDFSSKKPTVTLEKTTAITCECGNDTFMEAIKLRKASKFLTGTAEDGVIPVPVFICSQCGDVNQDTLYPALRTKKEDVNE